jgi:hypothetical protein
VLHRAFDVSELNEIGRDLERLSEAKDMKDVEAVLGPVELKQMTPALTGKLRKYLPDTGDPEKNYAARIELARIEGKVDVLHEEAKKARAELVAIRGSYGTVAPHSSANGKLPRENVAALGSVLFTDYLVPVELAAVLLLVATIGAIAIANRREGGLR